MKFSNFCVLDTNAWFGFVINKFTLIYDYFQTVCVKVLYQTCCFLIVIALTDVAHVSLACYLFDNQYFMYKFYLFYILLQYHFAYTLICLFCKLVFFFAFSAYVKLAIASFVSISTGSHVQQINKNVETLQCFMLKIVSSSKKERHSNMKTNTYAGCKG